MEVGGRESKGQREEDEKVTVHTVSALARPPLACSRYQPSKA